jgi:hypothetical protein
MGQNVEWDKTPTGGKNVDKHLDKKSANVHVHNNIIIVPDRRRRILEVVIVRHLITWVLGIWRGEGLGKGLRKGRSVYKQPETKMD